MYSRYLAGFVSPFIALVALLSHSAIADVLVLNNGDRITGEIKRIWDDEVTIEPEYSDEFTVDLSVVEFIESERVFEIELSDGRELLASFDGADPEGKQVINAEEETVAIELADMFELDEPEDAFSWESNIELAASLNKGNTNTSTSNVRADTTIKFNDHRHIGEVLFAREKLMDVSTKEQDLYRYSYNWIFNDPWFFGASLSYESDPIIELNNRTIVSAGIGRDLWNTPRTMLNVQLGAGLQQEDFVLQETEGSVGVWRLRYRQDLLSEDVNLFHNHSITYNITGRTNTSYRTSTGISYELTDWFVTSLTMNYNYETRPVEGARNEDIAILFGFGAEF